jgi:microcystin-dependent protein
MKHLFIITLLFALLIAPMAWSQTNTFSFQGTLRNDAGLAVEDGTYTINVSIYDAEISGNMLWTNTYNSVLVENGVYSIAITPENVSFDEPRYVGISVNGGAELAPRIPISAAPYAVHASVADTAHALPPSYLNQIAVPVGTILPYAGFSAPAGWLLCDGGAYPTSGDYENLYNVISTTFGGSGAIFNVPDFRGRLPMMPGGSLGGSLGDNGGNKNHTLTTGQIPSHNHSFSGNTSSDGNHTHGIKGDEADGIYGDAGESDRCLKNGDGVPQDDYVRDTENAGNHSHSFSGTTASTGSGQAFSLLNPYLMVNFIIKY